MIIGKRIVSVSNADTDYISVAEAKTHLRVTTSADDTYISNLISAALDMASHYVGYEVRESVCRYGFGELVGQPATVNPLNGSPLLVGNYCRIPARVISLDAFYYVNENNALTAFTDYITEPEPLSNFGLDLYLNSTPSNLTDAQSKYIAEVTEGFEPSSFPDSVKMACLLMVAQYYDNRQNIIVGVSATEMPYGSDFLLNKYKLSTFA
jgi:hypothetical protein